MSTTEFTISDTYVVQALAIGWDSEQKKKGAPFYERFDEYGTVLNAAGELENRLAREGQAFAETIAVHYPSLRSEIFLEFIATYDTVCLAVWLSRGSLPFLTEGDIMTYDGEGHTLIYCEKCLEYSARGRQRLLDASEKLSDRVYGRPELFGASLVEQELLPQDVVSGLCEAYVHFIGLFAHFLFFALDLEEERKQSL